MYGLFTIFSIILLPITTFLLAIGCANKEKTPPKENRMPCSTRTETPTPTSSTPDNAVISSKQAEASKQMSEGNLNFSALKIQSKEECEKTDLDAVPEDKMFANKIGKLKADGKSVEKKKVDGEKKKSLKGSKRVYKSNKKVPVPTPKVAPIAPPPQLAALEVKEVKQTEERGEVTQGTVMRKVDPAGQTQCSVMPTIAMPPQGNVLKKRSIERTVDQTIDGTSVLKETARSPAPGPMRSRQSLMKEINVEPSSNENKNENVTQYDKVLPSRMQPTQQFPPPVSQPQPAKEETKNVVEKGKKEENKEENGIKQTGQKNDKSKSSKKAKQTDGTTSEEQDQHKSLATPTQSDGHIEQVVVSSIQPTQLLPPTVEKLPEKLPSARKDSIKNVAPTKKEENSKKSVGKSVELGAVSLYMKP